MIALISAALAGSCCVPAGGADPGVLATCERLGVSLGVSGSYQTGSLAWDGRFVPRDALGTDRLSASLGVQGRPWDWLVLRLALPVQLENQPLEWSFPISAEARVEPWPLQTTTGWAVNGPSFSIGAGTLDGALVPSIGLSLEGSIPDGSWLIGGRAWLDRSILHYTGQIGAGHIGNKLDPSIFAGLEGDTTTSLAFVPFVGAALRYRATPITRIVGSFSADLPAGYSARTAFNASLTWLRVFPV